MQILVVEDEPTRASTLRARLARLGHIVIVAEDGTAWLPSTRASPGGSRTGVRDRYGVIAKWRGFWHSAAWRR